MAATLLGLVPGYPTGKRSMDKISYTVKLKVWCNDKLDGPKIAEFAAGVPNVGDFYSYGNDGVELFCWCISKDADEGKDGANGKLYTITCEYETPSQQTENGQIENPVLELPEVKTKPESRDKPMLGYWDEDDNLIAWKNSAGMIIEKPPMRKITVITKTISRNYDLGVDIDSMIIAFMNHVNQSEFWGWKAGTCLCTGIEPECKTQKLPDGTEYDYLRVHFSFEFSNEDDSEGDQGFKTQICDIGPFYLDGSGKKQDFLTEKGHNYIGKLDGSGGKLADGSNPVFLPSVDKYESAEFDVLNLPQSYEQCKMTIRSIF